MEKPVTKEEKAASPPIPNAPSPLKSNGMKYIAGGLVVVLVGTGGFFAGTQYAKTTNTNQRGGAIGGQNGMVGGGMGQMGNIGTVTAVTDTSITVSLRQGRLDRQSNSSSTSTTKTYTINTSTTITDNEASATISDIKTGDRVLIEADSSDSSIAASIALNPSMRGGPQGANGRTQNSDTDESSASSGSST